MPHYPKLMGEKVFLSPPASEDAELWAAWFNDLEVTLPLGDEAYVPFGLEKARDEVEDAVRRQQHVFSIVERQTEKAVGRCLLFNVDHVNRSAMLGIVIGEKSCWGRGNGQEATRLLLGYAFNLLNLHSVMLGAFAFNERALAAYRKVGFREIGRRREARLIGGRAYDAVLMDILETEFRERYGSTVGLEQTHAGR
jgi:RimJ/RimL family protein N-acetyltransferase